MSSSGEQCYPRVMLSPVPQRIGEYFDPYPTISSEVDERIDGQSLPPSSFEDDPEWPSLALPLGSDLFTSAGGPGDPAPFLGSGSPRIHRRFGDGAGFEAITSDQSAIRFLRRRLHIDLSDYTEYLGGLALVVPDPILRRIQHILVPVEGEQKVERLVYRLVPRPGQSLQGLRLTAIERRLNLLSRFETVDVPHDGIVSLESRPAIRSNWVRRFASDARSSGVPTANSLHSGSEGFTRCGRPKGPGRSSRDSVPAQSNREL